MSAAGLGLRLHDTLYGSDYNRVFQNWWEYAKRHYVPIRGGEVVGSMTMYYDPILGIHMPSDHEPFQKFGIAQLIQASRPDDARVLVEAALDGLGWREGAPRTTPGGNPREVIYGMIYAREYGDEGLHGRLKAYAEGALRADLGRRHRRIPLGLRARRTPSEGAVQRHRRPGRDDDRGGLGAPVPGTQSAQVHRTHGDGRGLPQGMPVPGGLRRRPPVPDRRHGQGRSRRRGRNPPRSAFRASAPASAP